MNNDLLKKNLLNWKYLLSIMIIIVMMASILSYADYNAIINFLKNINLLYITILLLSSVFLRALRWSLLLNKNNHKSKISLLFGIQLSGYFCNNILPLRLGEVV